MPRGAETEAPLLPAGQTHDPLWRHGQQIPFDPTQPRSLTPTLSLTFSPHCAQS
jgi:hypothetical protein